MRAVIKMEDIIRKLPSNKWFTCASVVGLHMTPPVFSARIKRYRLTGEIKSKRVSKRTYFFISACCRKGLLKSLSKSESESATLSNELFYLAMRV